MIPDDRRIAALESAVLDMSERLQRVERVTFPPARADARARGVIDMHEAGEPIATIAAAHEIERDSVTRILRRYRLRRRA